jgi:hypothetical protein
VPLGRRHDLGLCQAQAVVLEVRAAPAFGPQRLALFEGWNEQALDLLPRIPLLQGDDEGLHLASPWVGSPGEAAYHGMISGAHPSTNLNSIFRLLY